MGVSGDTTYNTSRRRVFPAGRASPLANSPPASPPCRRLGANSHVPSPDAEADDHRYVAPEIKPRDLGPNPRRGRARPNLASWLSEESRGSPLAFRTVRETFASHGSSTRERFSSRSLLVLDMDTS